MMYRNKRSFIVRPRPNVNCEEKEEDSCFENLNHFDKYLPMGEKMRLALTLRAHLLYLKVWYGVEKTRNCARKTERLREEKFKLCGKYNL